jgi:hypothetical protein
MIHCQQGISRSAAVALVWIYRQLPPSDDRHLRALDIVMELRPKAKPNRLVLSHGFAQTMDLSSAHCLAGMIISDPRVQRELVQGLVKLSDKIGEAVRSICARHRGVQIGCGWIAERLHMGSVAYVDNRLYLKRKGNSRKSATS